MNHRGTEDTEKGPSAVEFRPAIESVSLCDLCASVVQKIRSHPALVAKDAHQERIQEEH
jgi:hypothetical protein